MMNKHHSWAAYILGCLALCLLQACHADSLVQLSPEAGCWHAEEVLAFELEIAEEETFPVDIQLAFTDEYSFSNLYLKLSWTSPSGETDFIRFTESFIDPVGNWQMEKSGGVYPYSFQSFSQLKFTQGGLYRFELSHDMRKNPLCGVKHISVASAN